jgi:hypothetical protein
MTTVAVYAWALALMVRVMMYPYGRKGDLYRTLPHRPENLILVRLTDEGRRIVLPEYLYYVLEYIWLSGAWRRVARGTLQKYITVDDVKSISIGEAYRLGDIAEVSILGDKELRPGDILVLRVGSADTVGKPYIVKP